MFSHVVQISLFELHFRLHIATFCQNTTAQAVDECMMHLQSIYQRILSSVNLWMAVVENGKQFGGRGLNAVNYSGEREWQAPRGG